MLGTRTNRTFYEWAVTGVAPLDDYWHIVVTKDLPRRQPGEFLPLSLDDVGKVRPTFTDFPRLDEALRPLVCFPWQADRWRDELAAAQEAWHGFRVPFLIVVDDDLPRASPPCPGHDETGPGVRSSHGPGSGQRPAGRLDAPRRQRCRRLRGLRAPNRNASQPGGPGPRGAAVLRQRPALPRQGLLRRWNGKPFEEEVLTRHLREARHVARTILVWFVGFLTHLQEVARPREVPAFSRSDLHKLIDLDDSTRRLLNAFEALPAGFPAVAEWLAGPSS